MEGSGTCGLRLAPRPLSPVQRLARPMLPLRALLTEALTLKLAGRLEAAIPTLEKAARVGGGAGVAEEAAAVFGCSELRPPEERTDDRDVDAGAASRGTVCAAGADDL